MAITPKNNDLEEPKLFDFSYISMTNPSLFEGFYSIFDVGGTNFWIIKFVFLAFFEAKMTKIDVLNLKLIVPDDYQQFWVHFESFFALFYISDEKWLLS